MALPDLFPLRPTYREMIWGGRGLEQHLNKDLPPERAIGESWEVSACEGMESTVSEGPFSGWDLRSLVAEHGPELLGQPVYERYQGEFPLLIKLLDARDSLSIQVHPNDAYAKDRVLGPFGKMEAWYVIQSEGGRIVYGLQDGVNKVALQRAIQEQRVEELVRTFDVVAGDVVFIPPGTVHALCGGAMVYEVQQSSDLVFRIHDYDRLGPDGKPRELHIKRALDVIDFGGEVRKPSYWRQLPGATKEETTLVDSEHFRLQRFAPSETRTEHAPYQSFACLTLLDGEADLSRETESYPARKGDTFLIAANRAFSVACRDNSQVEYIISSAASS